MCVNGEPTRVSDTFVIVHYATSAMKRFLTSVSLQHEPKASDVITLVKKTFFARVSYEILYHEVWNKEKYGSIHEATRAIRSPLVRKCSVQSAVFLSCIEMYYSHCFLCQFKFWSKYSTYKYIPLHISRIYPCLTELHFVLTSLHLVTHSRNCQKI